MTADPMNTPPKNELPKNERQKNERQQSPVNGGRAQASPPKAAAL